MPPCCSFPKDQPGGAVIEEVTHGHASGKGGIEPGDIIVAWNGQRVTDSRSCRFMIARTEVGAQGAGQSVPQRPGNDTGSSTLPSGRRKRDDGHAQPEWPD